MVIAEDDRDIADLHRNFFSRVGGMEVWVTPRGRDLLALLENSGAGWLILDLELEDGSAVDLVSQIRERFGQEIFILILTGYWQIYPENALFPQGADDVLRKPHHPEGIYARMQRLVERMKGITSHKVQVLRVGAAILHLEKGILVRDQERILIPISYLNLLTLLAHRDGDHWRVLHRADLIVQLWGESVSNNPDAYGDRLRALVHRVRALVGPEAVQITGTDNKSSCYTLGDQVIVEEAAGI